MTLRSSLLSLLTVAACFDPDATPSAGSSTSSDSSTGSTSTSESSSSTTEHDTSSDPTAETTTSTTDDSTSTSTGEDDSTSTGALPTCLDSDAPFGEPTSLDRLNTDAGEGRPWLSVDELTLYFSSNRAGGPGGFDLFVATRDDVASPFAEPMRLSISTSGEEFSPALTSDGLSLYFTYDYDTYVSVRDSVVAEFGTPAPVAGINDVAGDYHPWISADGDVLYFNSERTGNSEIFVTERGPGGAFEEPVLVGELNTEETEDFPILSEDGLSIFFASARAGGVGESDIWTAKRSTLDDGFGAPTNVDELNTIEDEHPGWLSSDGCRLYLIRVVEGTRNILVAERSP